MAKEKLMAAAGLALLLISIAGIIFGGMNAFDSLGDPKKASLETLEFDSSRNSKSVTLEEGEYEIWVRGEDRDIKDLDVQDSNGDSVYQKNTGTSVSINERSYEKMGNLDIGEDGTYTVKTEEDCTLHITEEPLFDWMGFLKALGMLIGGIIGAIIGGILLLFSGIMSSGSQRNDGIQRPSDSQTESQHYEL